MQAIATADLHLTDRPEDEYRWASLRFVKRQARLRRVGLILLLGDLTDDKDNHSSALVNRAVGEICELSQVAPVFILKGNHDYTEARNPFFRFLGRVAGVTFINRPTGWKDCLFLPHTRKWRHGWEHWDFGHYSHIFLHQALKGSKQPSGFELEHGVPPSLFSHTKATILAGDQHTPQTVGNVTYCGSPHPVDFGDDFKPRIIHVDGNRLHSIGHRSIRKVVERIDALDELREKRFSRLRKGDRIRLTVCLARRDFSWWQEIRDNASNWLLKREIEVASIQLEERDTVRLTQTPPDETPIGENHKRTLKRFCSTQKIDRTLARVGQGLLT